MHQIKPIGHRVPRNRKSSLGARSRKLVSKNPGLDQGTRNPFLLDNSTLHSPTSPIGLRLDSSDSDRILSSLTSVRSQSESVRSQSKLSPTKVQAQSNHSPSKVRAKSEQSLSSVQSQSELSPSSVRAKSELSPSKVQAKSELSPIRV